MSPKRISALVTLWGLALVMPLGRWHALSFPFASAGRSSWVSLVIDSIAASELKVWMIGLQRVPASPPVIVTVLLPAPRTQATSSP